MKIQTQRVNPDELLELVGILMYNGHSQINMLFDWHTGEWEVSWTPVPPKTEEE